MPARVPSFYTERNSWLHRLDPRAKILWLLFVVVFLFSAPPWWWLGILAAVGVVMAITARLPAKWLALIMVIQIPNLLGFVFIPLTVAWIQGEVSFSEDIRTGIRLAFAWLGAAAVFTSIFATMRVDELTDGIRGVGLPKVVANGVGYAFRLLYSSLDDLFSIVDYLKHKGVDLQTRNPFKLLKQLPRVLVPAVTTVARRASSMMAALRMRGFELTGSRRPPLTLRRIGWAEVAFVLAGLLPVLAAIEQRWNLTPLALA
jgi:energy-coupling factor transport system permease protein